MELDDLKRSWEQYDKKLSENLKMNEELLRRSTLDRSRREMNTPLAFEILSVVIGVVFGLFMLSATIRYGAEMKYLISGIITLVYIGLELIGSSRKIRMLNRTDYYNVTVLELQKKLLVFQAFYTKERKWTLYLLPVVFFCVFPIVAKAIGGFDITAYPKVYLVNMLLVLVISYPLIIWNYRNWYDKKVKAANRFLSELLEFEKE